MKELYSSSLKFSVNYINILFIPLSARLSEKITR